METRLSVYECLLLSPPFLSKQTKQMFLLFSFSVVNSLQYIQNGRNITATVLRALEVANTVDSVSGSLTL